MYSRLDPFKVWGRLFTDPFKSSPFFKDPMESKELAMEALKRAVEVVEKAGSNGKNLGLLFDAYLIEIAKGQKAEAALSAEARPEDD